MGDLDPMGSVFKWARQEAKVHRGTFFVSGFGITAASVLATSLVSLPRTPTTEQRIVNGLIGLLIGAVVVLTLSMLYALTVAPYKQRNALRKRVGGALTPELKRAQELTATGRILASRFPEQGNSWVSLPDSLKSEFFQWERDVTEALTPWRDLQRQFREDIPMKAMRVQDMATMIGNVDLSICYRARSRFSVFNAIMDELLSTGVQADGGLLA